MRGPWTLGAVAATLSALPAGWAGAEVYPAATLGKHLAEQHCLSCHATGAGVDSAWHDRRPTLAELAPRIAADPDRYRLFLTNPHREMADVSLDRAQIDAIFAYVLSLRGER